MRWLTERCGGRHVRGKDHAAKRGGVSGLGQIGYRRDAATVSSKAGCTPFGERRRTVGAGSNGAVALTGVGGGPSAARSRFGAPRAGTRCFPGTVADGAIVPRGNHTGDGP